MNLIRQGNTLHLKRRVPVRYKRVETRSFVVISLRTDSEIEAKRKAAVVWEEMLASWEARLAGDTTDAEARYAAAREMAHRHGFRFLPMDKVVALPISELVERVEATRKRDGTPDMALAAALLGGAEVPGITITRALELFWGLAEDRTQGKSENQLRLWRNPRKKAIKNFVDVVGDITLDQITTDDTLRFREWWWDKIRAEKLTPNSANKDFSYLADTLRTVNKMKRLGLTLPLDGLTIRDGTKGHRPPFTEDFIREKLLAPGALDGLNLQARCLLLGMVNTGYRPSEGASLTAATIRLDVDVPHISIEPGERTLKSQYSERMIPLVGVSLEAFKACPDGFARYADKAGASATINKYLRENNLLETDDHSLYGLRHSFEDRMLDRDVDERIRRDLMGHTLNRQRYGKGASLEKLRDVIQSVAL